MEAGARYFGEASAINSLFWVKHTVFYCGECGYDLKGRTWGIGTLNRFCSKRPEGVFIQLSPVFDRNSANEKVRVKCRCRGQSSDVAVFKVDHHRAG